MAAPTATPPPSRPAERSSARASHTGSTITNTTSTTSSDDTGRPSLATVESVVRVSPTATKERHPLEKAEQTMLGMVWLRHLDAAAARPVLGDAYARGILDRCAVDTSQTTFFTDGRGATDARAVAYVANRGRRLDAWAQAFVDAHEARGAAVTVVHLGCGLDCRSLRVRRGDGVRWVDLDRAMVVNLRERVLLSPPGDYSLRTLDVEQEGWMKDIPADRPTLIVAEGVFPYISADRVPRLIHDLVEYFGEGQLIFDVMGQLLVKYTSFNKFLKSSKSAFTWGCDDAHVIETYHPRLKLKENIFRKEYMRGVLPLFGKTGNLLCSMHPADRYNGQFLRFEFTRPNDQYSDEKRN